MCARGGRGGWSGVALRVTLLSFRKSTGLRGGLAPAGACALALLGSAAPGTGRREDPCRHSHFAACGMRRVNDD